MTNTHEKNKKQDNHAHTHAHAHSHANCCGSKTAETIVSTISSTSSSGNSSKIVFKVANMDCPDEIKAITDALRIEGVLSVSANLMASTVEVSHLEHISSDVIKKKINSTVVKVVEGTETVNHNKIRIMKVVISGITLSLGLVFELILSHGLFANIFYAIAIISGGTLIFPKAFGALKRMSLDMNVLMTFAVVGALIIKQYSEGATVVFLFALSELLESLSVQRARNAIEELFKLTPLHTFLVKGNQTSEVLVDDVKVGEIIRVKAGENIPLDGKVIAGSSHVNQASLTGESSSITKNVGDGVYAGTINEDGSLDVEVSALSSDSKLSQVIRLVAESQAERAPAQQFVDRFARIYTPLIFLLAILTYLIPVFLMGADSYEWFYKSLVLLVIACPCALVISTPISIVSSLTSLARNGVLVKGGVHLEMLGKISAIALDKTGTLTEGKPEVASLELINNINELEFLKIASSLESHSTHPLAEAILKYAKTKGINPLEISEFKNIPGKGIEAQVEGVSYFAGNLKYVSEQNLLTEEIKNKLLDFEHTLTTLVIIGKKTTSESAGLVYGWINFRDKIKENAIESLISLKKSGIREITILSGDNHKTTSFVGNHVKADYSYGDLLPEDKLRHIEKILEKHQFVAMVGDGVNDAPAMAKSSLGIAMGAIGSGVAIETADMTLMADDLKQISVAINVGRRTLQIIKFNITFAIVTKIIFLILTYFGYSNLWMAIIADTGATLIVVLNSLRLLSVKK